MHNGYWPPGTRVCVHLCVCVDHPGPRPSCVCVSSSSTSQLWTGPQRTRPATYSSLLHRPGAPPGGLMHPARARCAAQRSGWPQPAPPLATDVCKVPMSPGRPQPCLLTRPQVPSCPTPFGLSQPPGGRVSGSCVFRASVIERCAFQRGNRQEARWLRHAGISKPQLFPGPDCLSCGGS